MTEKQVEAAAWIWSNQFPDPNGTRTWDDVLEVSRAALAAAEAVAWSRDMDAAPPMRMLVFKIERDEPEDWTVAGGFKFENGEYEINGRRLAPYGWPPVAWRLMPLPEPPR